MGKNRHEEESPLEVTLRLCKGFDIDQKHMREARLIYIRATEEMKQEITSGKKKKEYERVSEQARQMAIRTYAENATAKYIIEHASFYR